MSQSSDKQDLVRSPGKVPADLSIVVPLKDAVVFPHAVVPLALFRASSAAAIEEAVSHGRSVVFVLQQDPDVKAPGLADLHEIGTVCKIGRYMTTPDGAHHVVVGGEAGMTALFGLALGILLAALLSSDATVVELLQKETPRNQSCFTQMDSFLHFVFRVLLCILAIFTKCQPFL